MLYPSIQSLIRRLSSCPKTSLLLGIASFFLRLNLRCSNLDADLTNFFIHLTFCQDLVPPAMIFIYKQKHFYITWRVIVSHLIYFQQAKQVSCFPQGKFYLIIHSLFAHMYCVSNCSFQCKESKSICILNDTSCKSCLKKKILTNHTEKIPPVMHWKFLTFVFSGLISLEFCSILDCDIGVRWVNTQTGITFRPGLQGLWVLQQVLSALKLCKWAIVLYWWAEGWPAFSLVQCFCVLRHRHRDVPREESEALVAEMWHILEKCSLPAASCFWCVLSPFPPCGWVGHEAFWVVGIITVRCETTEKWRKSASPVCWWRSKPIHV